MKFTTILSALAAAGLTVAQDCPAPGTTNSDGDYSCNPAHQYPDGQLCVVKNDGCYYLEGTGLIIPSTTTSPAPYPSATCPAPGTTNSAGDYSCNPAHQYPDGQLCVLMNDGCYYLEGTGLIIPSSSSSMMSPPPSSSSAAAACPAPGTTNAIGYLCNPAHQYPGSQVCMLKSGCYYLQNSTMPTMPTMAPTPKPSIIVVAGAAHQSALGGLAAAVALFVALI